CELRRREGARFATCRQRAVETLHTGGAGLGERQTRLGHLGFEAVEPGGIARTVFEEAGAFAHRGFVACGVPGMRRLEAEHQAVEEAAAAAPAFDEEAVPFRRAARDLDV